MCFIYACKHTSFFLTTIHVAHFFAEEGKNPPSYLLFLATNRIDLLANFLILTQFKEDLYEDIPIIAKDDKVQYVLYPKPGKDPIAVAIFVPSSAGFA